MGVSCVFYSTQIYKLLTAVNDHRRVYRCTGVLWAQAPRLAKRMGNVLCTLSSSAMYYSREDLNVYGAGGGGRRPQRARSIHPLPRLILPGHLGNLHRRRHRRQPEALVLRVPHLTEGGVALAPALDGPEGEQGDDHPEGDGAGEHRHPAVPEGLAVPEGGLGRGQRIPRGGAEGVREGEAARDSLEDAGGHVLAVTVEEVAHEGAGDGVGAVDLGLPARETLVELGERDRPVDQEGQGQPGAVVEPPG